MRPERPRLALFAIGLAIALLMLWRAQVAGDALALLSRGWLFAEADVWVPFGNPAASEMGGFVPGGLTALLVGFPLELWMDPRAPVVLLLLLHVAAYCLLDRIVAQELGQRARIVFAVVYWLNPWRLYKSSWLDNSNYVFFSGAVHLWACLRQRWQPSWLHSAVLVAVVGLTAQLHLNAAILFFAAVLLCWRGYWRPHWSGIALGAALVALTLVPWAIAAAHEPEILPHPSAPLGRSLIEVWPAVKSTGYWLRYASLSVSSAMQVYDFTPTFGSTADRVLTPAFTKLGLAAAVLTIPIALAANIWLLRRQRRQRRKPAGTRTWLCGYAVWTFAACLISNLLSPASVMWWHNLIAFHAAVLPLVLWTDALWRARPTLVPRSLACWAACSIVLLLGMSVGANQFRSGGRDARRWILPRYDRVVLDLNLTEHGVTVDPARGSRPLNNRLLYKQYLRPYEIRPAADD